MLPNYEELICFAAVCKTGSFTQAANLLDCSKANVSRKINSLEKRVGSKLLHRSTRTIYLTEFGMQLKDKAIKALDDIQLLDKRVRDDEGGLNGHFRITAPVSLSASIFAPIVLKLQESFPNVQFELIPTNENVKLLESGVDLAIRTGSVVDDSLVARKLGEFHEGFFTSSANIELYNNLNLNSLSSSPLLVNVPSKTNNCLNLFENGKMVTLEAKKAINIQEYLVALNLMFESEHIAWLPNYFEGVTRGRDKVIRLLPHLKGQSWPVYMVFPFQTPLPIKLKSILESIESHFSNTFN